MVAIQCMKLLPFFATSVAFFHFEAYKVSNHGQLWSTVLKCLPIYSLIIFACLQQSHKYRTNIIVGLVLSSIGDILLNNDIFLPGMAAFLFAHFFYIKCFGWRPGHPIIGVTLYVLAAMSVSLFFVNLPGVMKPAVTIYAIVLATTGWRAIARATESVPSRLCAIGAVLFVISDALIAFDRFYADIPNVQVLIMATYYAAQWGIAMVVLDVDKKKM